jgi:peroxiredoxin Q/BCP
MAQLRQQHDEFISKNALVVVVGPESPEAFRSYWEKEKLPFLGLPDPDHLVLDRYGQEFKLLRLGRMPAQVIVDQQGISRFAHYGDSMSDIPATGELLALLDELNAPAYGASPEAGG